MAHSVTCRQSSRWERHAIPHLVSEFCLKDIRQAPCARSKHQQSSPSLGSEPLLSVSSVDRCRGTTDTNMRFSWTNFAGKLLTSSQKCHQRGNPRHKIDVSRNAKWRLYRFRIVSAYLPVTFGDFMGVSFFSSKFRTCQELRVYPKAATQSIAQCHRTSVGVSYPVPSKGYKNPRSSFRYRRWTKVISCL